MWVCVCVCVEEAFNADLTHWESNAASCCLNDDTGCLVSRNRGLSGAVSH